MEISATTGEPPQGPIPQKSPEAGTWIVVLGVSDLGGQWDRAMKQGNQGRLQGHLQHQQSFIQGISFHAHVHFFRHLWGRGLVTMKGQLEPRYKSGVAEAGLQGLPRSVDSGKLVYKYKRLY